MSTAQWTFKAQMDDTELRDSTPNYETMESKLIRGNHYGWCLLPITEH